MTDLRRRVAGVFDSIVTERLRLRRPLASDLAAIPEPIDGDWWVLTVETLDGGQIIGEVSFTLQCEGRAAEIGYALAREHWGNGYAHEATGGLVDWLFSDSNRTRISAILHPENHRSARVVERLGFVHEGHTRLSGWAGDENTDDWVYGITRTDYDAWRARPTGPPGTRDPGGDDLGQGPSDHCPLDPQEPGTHGEPERRLARRGLPARALRR